MLDIFALVWIMHDHTHLTMSFVALREKPINIFESKTLGLWELKRKSVLIE